MFRFSLNRLLLPMKGHYFFWNAGTGPVVPFMSVYARQLGFSSVVVGIIYTILPISGMIAKPAMGMVVDRYKCQKIVFLIAQFVAAVMFLLMIFLPQVPNHAKMHFACDSSEAALDACIEGTDSCAAIRLQNDISHTTIKCQLTCPFKPEHLDTVCKHWKGSQHCISDGKEFKFTAHVPMDTVDQIGNCIYFLVNNVTLENGDVRYPLCPNSSINLICDTKCDSYILNEYLNESAVKDSDVYKLPEFWILLGVYLIAWLGQAVTVSVGDTICFELLGDQPSRYGFQRMYGSLGWGIFSIAAGALVDVYSKGQVSKNYASSFCMGVSMLLVSIIVSSRIRQQLSASIIKDIGRLLSKLRVIIFMLWCISVGLCTALMWNFLFWLLEDLASQQGCDVQSWIKTIEGLVMGIQCLAGELPFFFLSNWILKRIGHIHCMSLVLLVIGIRFILYSVITNPWHCLPIELLNGVTFGLFYATMASYASIVAPTGVETTTQGLVGAVFEGIGVSTGSFIGGILFNAYGGTITFRIYGIAALVVCLLHALVQYLMKNKEDSVTKYSAPQDAIRMVNNNEAQELNVH